MFFFCPEFKDENLLADLLLTIASLCVRNEFCMVVEEAGGLQLIVEIMRDHMSSTRLIKETFKLIRALAGNDTVKVHIMQCGVAPLIEAALDTHKVCMILKTNHFCMLMREFARNLSSKWSNCIS